MVSLVKTYKIESPPIPAMEWRQYEQNVNKEWHALLDRKPEPEEREVHIFLEKKPCLIPGAFNLYGHESGHAPIYWAVISQPPLPSYPHKKPDFMWFSRNSAYEEPVLVEIEAPYKKWFIQSGQESADLTQARNQVIHWKSWFANPVNELAFRNFYDLENRLFKSRTFRPSYALVYGRRAEATANPEANVNRGQSEPNGVTMMTYDRLTPNPKATRFISVSVQGNGKLVAKAVPPTLEFGPDFAKTLRDIAGIPDAIEACELIPPARKQFLIGRIEYWIDWEESGKRGVIELGDAE